MGAFTAYAGAEIISRISRYKPFAVENLIRKSTNIPYKFF